MVLWNHLGNGVFVTVGTNGTVLTSTDGIDWQAQTSGTSAHLHDVAWNGAQFVAVGDGAIITSSDAVNWSVQTVEGLHRSVAWNGSVWAAVKENANTVSVSADGLDWQAHDTGLTATLNSVTAAGSRFFAACDNRTIVTSLDGVVWQLHPLEAEGVPAEVSFKAILWDGERFLAIGTDEDASDDHILVSQPGSEWRYDQASLPRNLYDIADSGTLFVAVGENGQLLASPDGSDWTRVPTPPGKEDAHLYGVVWTGSRFVAVGQAGTVVTSADGMSWTAADSDLSQDLLSVAATTNFIVAVGRQGTIAISDGGDYWTPRSSGTNADLTAVASSGSALVAAGAGGTLLRSPSGMDWYPVDTLDAYFARLAQSGGQTDLMDVSWSGKEFLLSGAGGVLAMGSSDGRQWQLRFLETDLSVATCGGNGQPPGWTGYALGMSDGSLRFSQGVIVPAAGSVNAMVWRSDRFVAVGNGGNRLALLPSSDLPPPETPSADLEVSVRATAVPVQKECGQVATPGTLTYTLELMNNGTGTATWPAVSALVYGGENLSTMADTGGCDAPVNDYTQDGYLGYSPQTVRCACGPLAAGEKAVFTFHLDTSHELLAAFRADAQSAEVDPEPSNNDTEAVLFVEENDLPCPPTPFDGAFEMPEDGGIAVGQLQAGVVFEEGDPEVTITAFEIVDYPAHGSVSLAGDIVRVDDTGSLPSAEKRVTLSDDTGPLNDDSAFSAVYGIEFQYQPDLNYAGEDAFTFKVTDSNGTVSKVKATISVTIIAVNDPPAAVGSSITTIKNTAVHGSLNATDPDTGDVLSFFVVDQPSSGQVSITDVQTGAFIYTPDTDFFGTDWFTFQAQDDNVDAQNTPAPTASNIATVSVAVLENRAYTTLSMELSSRAILQNDALEISGKLTRLPETDFDLSGQSINITIIAPDNTTNAQNTMTYDRYGHFEILDVAGFNQKGQYQIQANFVETSILAGSQVSDTVLVGASAGYAIIVQGKIDSQEGIASHNKSTNRIYQALRERGLREEDITYFNYDLEQAGVIINAVPLKSAIQNAIEGWALQKMNSVPAPLYLIMVDHGNPETFYLGAETIVSEELDEWLDVLEEGLHQAARLEPRIVILGACYSGSFLPAVSKEGRVIVTSAAEDEESYKGPLEPDNVRVGEFFLEELFHELKRGFSLKAAFRTAAQKTEIYTRKGGTAANSPNRFFDLSMQHPLLDDNGDEVGSNNVDDPAGDGQNAETIFLGTGMTNNAAGPADLKQVAQTLILGPEENTAVLQAEAYDDSRVASAWIEVRAPSVSLEGTGTTGQLEVQLDKKLMTYSEDIGLWQREYAGFSEPGTYEILYFTRDSQTSELSPMKRSLVYRNNVGNNIPEAFNLISPADGSEQKTVLLFDWQDATDPDGDILYYALSIATDSLFQNEIYRVEEIANSVFWVDQSAALPDLTTLFWRIAAVDRFGGIRNSDFWQFSTNNTNFVMPGWIRGYVFDAMTGNLIPDASFEITGIANFITMDTGYYLGPVPAGNYEAVVSAEGYRAVSLAGLCINSSESIVRNFGLIPLLGDLNKDGKSDLVDIITALQCMAGAETSSIRPDFAEATADVQKDKKVGMEEVLYLLQSAAGLRP